MRSITRSIPVLTTLIAALAFLGPVTCGGAARALPATTAELPTPLPEPYDPKADPRQAIADALARAKARHARVLIEFGGNWCGDCKVMAGVMALPEVAPTLSRAFEIVSVDVGRINRNLDVAEAYGAHLKAVPTVIVLEPDGSVAPRGVITSLGDARAMTPQAIVDTLLSRAR